MHPVVAAMLARLHVLLEEQVAAIALLRSHVQRDNARLVVVAMQAHLYGCCRQL